MELFPKKMTIVLIKNMILLLYFLHREQRQHPKVVPLTHANLIRTVDTATGMFDLNKDDRSISVIPLFHIYGIVGPLFSSVAVGSSIVFLPAFNPQEFFPHSSDFKNNLVCR